MVGAVVLLIVILGYFFNRWWEDHTWDSGAPYEGMPADVVQRVVDLAEIGPNDIFYDLGSGDGRLVVAAAMKGAAAYGVEIDKLRALISRFWIWMWRLKDKARIINGDVFETSISDATVVCVYLLP